MADNKNRPDVELLAGLNKAASEQQIKKDAKKLKNIWVYLKAKLDLSHIRKQLSRARFVLQIIANTKGVQSATIQAMANAQKIANKNKIKYTLEMDRAKLQNELKNFAKMNSKLFSSKEMTMKYNQLLDASKVAKTKREINNLRKQLSAFKTELIATNKAGMTWADKFKASISHFTQYFMGASFIYTMIYQLRNAWTEAKELDDSLVDLQKVTSEIEDRNSLYKYFDKALDKANDLNVKVNSLIYAITEFKKLGWSLEDAELGGEWATKLANVGDVDIDTAIGSIKTSIASFEEIGGYGDDQMDKKLEAYADLINNMSNKYSIDAEGLAEAIRLSAGTLTEANTTIEQAATMFATANKYYNDPEYLGNTAKIGSLRLRATTGDKSAIKELSEMGEDVEEVTALTGKLREELISLTGVDIMVDNNTFKSYYDQLYEISQVIDDLDDTTSAKVLETLFGKNRAAAGMSLLSGLQESEKAYADAINSAGSATAEYETWMESADAATQRFSNSLTELYQSILNGNTVRDLANAGSAVLDFANTWGLVEGAVRGYLTLKIGTLIANGTMAFISATKQVEQYGKALRMANTIPNGNLSQRFSVLRNLATVTSALTAEQLKQVLSSQQLSYQDRIRVLRLQGLSREMAVQKLTEMQLTQATNAQTTATNAQIASTFNLKSALVGLGATMKSVWLSNPVGITLMAISLSFSAVSSAMSKHKQELEEIRQKNIEASETSIEQADSLRELYTEYTRLSSIQNRTNEEEEQFKSVIEDVTKALGDKAQSLEGLTVGTKKYAEALANVTKEELRSASVKATVGRKSVEEDIKASKIWSDWSGSTVHIDSNDKGKGLSENAQRAVDIVSDALKDYETVNQTWRNVSWDISNDNPEELYEYYSALIRAREELVVASKSNEELLNTEIYDDLNSAINTMSDSMDSYISKRYEEEKLTYMAQRGIPQTTEAYRIMESTLLGGLSAYDDMQKKFKELLSVDFPELIKETEEVVDNVANEDIKDAPLLNLSTQLTNSKEALETFTSSVHSAFDAYSTLMNPNVSSADMLSSITQLSELAKTMGKDLNWEMLYGFGDTVTQLGSSIEYISEEYAKSVLSGAGIDSKFVDMLAHSIVQAKQAETQLSRLDSQIDSLQSSYTDLTDIIETYNSNGYITFDQLQKLLALEPQYLACLVDENGQLSLNNESMRLLAEQRLNEAKAQIIQQAITELSELVTHKETTALADNITTRQEQLGKLSEYNTKMADAITKTAVETELVRELNAELGNASANGASDEDINNVLNNAYKKLKLVDDIGAKTTTNLGGIMGGSSSSSAKDTSKTFDWIETLISRIQRNITNLGKLVSATYRNWSTRNNALAQEMAEVNKEINAQMTAYNAYMEKANSIPLSEGYKALVRSGAYDISTITDEKLQEQISEYEEWYNKALDASDAIEDLRANLADLAKTKFDNISKQYEDLISNTTHYTSMVEGYVDQSEAAGYMASEVYYKAMADKQQENIAQLQGEYSSLLSAFDEAVKNGSIQKYSSDWYEMLGAINDVELELQDATTQLIEFNQTLQQLSWEVFDRVRESVSDIVTEAEFLVDILDSKDLHTDKGVITDEGLAVQGLHAVNYNTYMEQAIAYAEEMRKIEAEMAKDPYDMELVDRRNELLELQQEAIQNAMDEKSAIVDLISEGYDKMLESLQKVIDKNKEALNAEKSLFDYERDIESKTSNIASLRKQLQAYSGDNSEQARSTIQKLQLSLSEAEKDLKQTEYEKFIEDSQQLLDSLMDDTQEWVNTRLDDIDGLISESIDATNKNAETISSTIKETANSYGYGISDQMETIWDSANDVVCTYGDILKGTNENIANNITTGTTNVVTAINGLNGSMQTMIGKLNEIATANANSIAQAQNAVVNGQNNSYPTNNKPSTPTVSTTTTTKPSTQSSKKPTSTPKYNILNQDGIIINSNLTEEEAKKIVSANGHRGWRMVKAYKSGTTNADKGFHLVSDGNGDEIVLTNDGNAVLAKGMQLFPFEGGETVFDATKTAELLKGSLVPLSADQLWGNIVKTPKLPEMSKGVGGNVTNNNQFSFELPNVVDADSFITELQHSKRFEKIIDSMTAGKMMGKGSFDKFRF